MSKLKTFAVSRQCQASHSLKIIMSISKTQPRLGTAGQAKAFKKANQRLLLSLGNAGQATALK